MENLQIVPASRKNVEAQYVEMMVPLYSYGCEKKVNKALANLKGIYSVNVDFHRQKVTVWGICDKHDVLNIVKSKRKGARFWDSELDVVQVQESHSAPPLPQRDNATSLPKTTKRYLTLIKAPSFNLSSTRYLTMMKAHSFNLSSATVKAKSLSWKLTIKKAFTRSNSFRGKRSMKFDCI